MITYKSKSGKASGISAYEIGKDFIVIQFNNKKKYKYSYESTGSKAIEQMKIHALSSEGLSTYISRNKPRYERKKSVLQKISSHMKLLFMS